MTQTKQFLFILLSLALFNSCLTNQVPELEQPCSPSCLNCRQARCLACFKSALTPTYQCIPEPHSARRCIISSFSATGKPTCQLCKDGFYTADKWGTGDNKCFRLTKRINHCVWHQYSATKDQMLCRACENGHYPAWNAQSCKKDKAKLENCLWSSAPGECMRCVSGFTSVSDSVRDGLCVPQKIEGCMRPRRLTLRDVSSVMDGAGML